MDEKNPFLTKKSTRDEGRGYSASQGQTLSVPPDYNQEKKVIRVFAPPLRHWPRYSTKGSSAASGYCFLS
jgi:hypothetical protein